MIRKLGKSKINVPTLLFSLCVSLSLSLSLCVALSLSVEEIFTRICFCNFVANSQKRLLQKIKSIQENCQS